MNHDTDARAPATQIRTPDQRLRVFVSSTLTELGMERRAARAAIESLRLAPVMFELGARPHPPRDLYRAYLRQSDIFVGIYGDRYGWVAPGEDVSGLEDEYRLADGLPLLIYIREPAPGRDERLRSLLRRIREDDRTSYRAFESPDDLATLLTDDLSTLLADRFDASRAGVRHDAPSGPAPLPPIPAVFSRLIGRTGEYARARELLDDPTVRMLTIVGPGGIGKSRLAIELAHDISRERPVVAFAALEGLTLASQVIPTIARALGVRDTGEAPLRGTLVAAIADRDVLLVVDNMEHLIDATPDLVELLTDAPRLTMLVTSRSPLRVRAERIVELGPLDVPATGAGVRAAGITSGVELFVDRARSVRPDFELSPENTPAVVGIVRAVDGVPLAIEIAAARLRLLTVHEVLTRLDSVLSLLITSGRDLPPRQRALRSTIEWSVRMLDASTRDAYARLSVFTGPFTLAAADAVLGLDALAAVENLLEASLLRHQERASTGLFVMLSVVRAHAGEMLEQSPADLEQTRDRWVSHYGVFAREASEGMQGSEQFEWLARADAEAENVVGVMRHLLSTHSLDAAAEFAWTLYLPGWIGGLLGLLRSWGGEILRTARSTDIRLTAHAEAISLYYANAIRFWEDPDADVVPGLRHAVELFEESGDLAGAALTRVSLALALLAHGHDDRDAPEIELRRALDEFVASEDTWGQAMTRVALGRVALASGDVASAREHFAQSLEAASASVERLGISIAQVHLAWTLTLSGDLDGARDLFDAELRWALQLGHAEATAYGLEGFVGLAAAQGRAELAGTIAGAAEVQRRRSGFVNPGFLLHHAALTRLRDAGMDEDVSRGLARGRSLATVDAVALIDRDLLGGAP